VLLAQFRDSFPEFRTCSDPFVQSYLDFSERFVSASKLGEQYDLAHGYKTAHLIATAPGGAMAKLVAKDGSTTYGKGFLDILKAKLPGVIVV
jgi:hypothetical protein